MSVMPRMNIDQIRLRRLDFSMLGRPLVPRFAFAVLFHERAEECIIIEPGGFLRAKILKCGFSILARMLAEICERLQYAITTSGPGHRRHGPDAIRMHDRAGTTVLHGDQRVADQRLAPHRT